MEKPKKQKRQDPAFRLYTSDFLVRTLGMSDEQVGKLIRLICFQHQTGHIKESDMLLYCKGRDEVVFAKFNLDDNGLFYNEDVEIEVYRRDGLSQQMSGNSNQRWHPEEISEDIDENTDIPF